MKSKIMIMLFTILLVPLCVGVALLLSDSEHISPFSVIINLDDHQQETAAWENTYGDYYVFIPSGADIDSATFKLNTKNPISIDGVSLSDGLSCKNFTLDTQHTLTYTSWGKEHSRKLMFVQSSGVATMFIETQSGNMEHIHADKENEEQGTIHLMNPNGTTNYSGKLDSISGRGHSSWYDEKKPYSLTLSQESDLLEMGTAQKWVLLSNFRDTSNLNNKLIYDFASSVGMPYSPNSQWVDLYLNGEYAGLYLLSEKNEVQPNRVDISINGSFLVSTELGDRLDPQAEKYITTDANQYLRIRYPLNPTAESLDEINKVWQSAENAILAEDGIDPVTEKSWLELIDLDSWVKKYLIEEIFGNLDACRISQYFYLDASDSTGKIFAGPVWDYDYSMGTNITNPTVMCVNSFFPKFTPWFYYLYQRDEFYARVVEIYQEEFLPELDKLLSETLTEHSSQISKADALNRIRWSISSDMQKDIERRENYLSNHINLLTDLWVNQKNYCFVEINYGRNSTPYVLAIPQGEALSLRINSETSDFLGWYHTNTNDFFDVDQPITNNVSIAAKWKDNDDLTLTWLVELLNIVLTVVFLGVLAAFAVIAIIRIKRERVTINGRK